MCAYATACNQTSNLTTCSPPPLSIFTNLFATHPYNTRVETWLERIPVLPEAAFLALRTSFSLVSGKAKLGGVERRASSIWAVRIWARLGFPDGLAVLVTEDKLDAVGDGGSGI